MTIQDNATHDNTNITQEYITHSTQDKRASGMKKVRDILGGNERKRRSCKKKGLVLGLSLGLG
jgi:hypothetical protein